MWWRGPDVWARPPVPPPAPEASAKPRPRRVEAAQPPPPAAKVPPPAAKVKPAAGGRAQRDKAPRRTRTSGLPRPGRSVFGRVLRYSAGSWPRLLTLLVLDLIAIPLALLTPVALKIAVDSVVGDSPLPGFIDAVLPGWAVSSDGVLLVTAAVLQVLVVLLAQVQEMSRYVLSTFAGEQLTLGVRSRLFMHMQRQSVQFHDARGTADSVYRVEYDAPSFQYITVDGLIPFLSSGLMLATMLVVIARLDLQLALVALGVCPFLIWFFRRFSGRVRPRYRDLAGAETDAMNVVQEVLSALRVVKAFGRERNEHERFVSRSSEGVRQRIRLSFAEGAFGLLTNLATAVGTASVLLIGIGKVQGGSLTLGEFLMVVAYLSQLYAPLKTINATFAAIQKALAGAERVFEVLDRVPEVTERPNARPLRRAAGRIEFDRAAFAYDPRQPVLSDLSFVIEPGTRAGIVGPTGAGKTTLVSLITRFFDVTEGAILLDGRDLRDYKVDDLRRQFAIVLQEPVLFSTTIAENIAFGRAGAPREMIVEAAKAANAHDFITGLPDGYDTLVGERGARLSGGERQRISLARAFVKDAPVLVLDEPTSSVDVETEAQIIDAMDRLMDGRTTLMIAHRFSTLQDCDMLIAVQDGRIAINPESTPDGFPLPDTRAAEGGRTRRGTTVAKPLAAK